METLTRPTRPAQTKVGLMLWEIPIFPDQQEKSDEDDSDSGSQGNGDTNSTVIESETLTLTKNNLTLIHWNTQGANEKIGLLQAEIANHDIDVVLLQDTRLKQRQDGIARLRMDGYHTYHMPLSIDPDVQCQKTHSN